MRHWTLGFSCLALDKLQCCQRSSIYGWAGYTVSWWRSYVHLPWGKCTSDVHGTAAKRPCVPCSPRWHFGALAGAHPMVDQGSEGQIHSSSARWGPVQVWHMEMMGWGQHREEVKTNLYAVSSRGRKQTYRARKHWWASGGQASASCCCRWRKAWW